MLVFRKGLGNKRNVIVVLLVGYGNLFTHGVGIIFTVS